MKKLAIADDDLEDDSSDPHDIPTADLSRPVRKLAAAVLLQAVLDCNLQDPRQREDATEFLNPRSIPARYAPTNIESN